MDVGYEYPVLAIREVHDGDTYRFDLDVGFEHAAWPWLRLKDYSCPELGSVAGADAKAAAETALHNGLAESGLWVRTFKRLGYEDTKKTFARYIADVYVGDFPSRSGALFGEALAMGGFARHGSFKG